MCEILVMPWSLRIGAVRERLAQPLERRMPVWISSTPLSHLPS
jgi:hypothetical protein